jgi:hypothetical protein
MTTDDALPTVLRDLLAPRTSVNPALDRVLADYATYHLVFVVLAGALVVALLVVGGLLIRRSRRMRTEPGAAHASARRTSLGLGLGCVGIAALFTVLVAANAGNGLDPRPGLGGAIGEIRPSAAGSTRAAEQDAFAGWLRSGDEHLPAPVRGVVERRVAWQAPKAVGSALLLGVSVWLTAGLWRRLIRTAGQGPDLAGRRAWLSAAMASSGVSLVLMAMTIGNTQGALAPLVPSLLYG